jgi:hypothetical protein
MMRHCRLWIVSLGWINLGDRSIQATTIALCVLHPPLGHGAEKVAGTIRMGLDFAPFGVIAKVQNAEVIDRFSNSIAGADQK